MAFPSWKAALPHGAVIAGFLLVSTLFFNPILSGLQLRQSDISNHVAMSKEIVDHRESKGEEPLWTNSMFGGMPAYQISMKNPGNRIDYAIATFDTAHTPALKSVLGQEQ